jgi:lipopolysaccharide assembly protein A
MRFVKVVFLILLFFISMMFFIQNTEVLSQSMSLKLSLFTESLTLKSVPLPFYFLLLIGFVLGGALVLFYFLLDKIRLTKALKHNKGRIAKLEQEVNSLRNLPLDNSMHAGHGETPAEKEDTPESSYS